MWHRPKPWLIEVQQPIADSPTQVRQARDEAPSATDRRNDRRPRSAEREADRIRGATDQRGGSAQRVGRAGHRVGETSVGTLFPTHAQDFLEAAVLSRALAERDIEPGKLIDAIAEAISSAARKQYKDRGVHTEIDPDRLRNWYDFQNKQVDISYARFEPAGFKDVEMSDAEVRQRIERELGEGGPLVRERRVPPDGFAERRFPHVMVGVRLHRQEAAADLVFALGPGFEHLDTLLYAVLNALVVGGFEMQPGHITRATPVAAVQAPAAGEKYGHGDGRVFRHGKNGLETFVEIPGDGLEESGFQRRVVAVVPEGVDIAAVDEIQIAL